MKLDEAISYLTPIAESADPLMHYGEALSVVLDAAKADLLEDDCESKLAKLLWHLTDGRMSGTGYDVETMVQEVEAAFERNCDLPDEDAVTAAIESQTATYNPVESWGGESLKLEDESDMSRQAARAVLALLRGEQK